MALLEGRISNRDIQYHVQYEFLILRDYLSYSGERKLRSSRDQNICSTLHSTSLDLILCIQGLLGLSSLNSLKHCKAQRWYEFYDLFHPFCAQHCWIATSYITISRDDLLKSARYRRIHLIRQWIIGFCNLMSYQATTSIQLYLFRLMR